MFNPVRKLSTIGVVALLAACTAPAFAQPHWGGGQSRWRSILDNPSDFYGTDESIRVAENVLLYQNGNGGWPKNIEMAATLSDERSGRPMTVGVLHLKLMIRESYSLKDKRRVIKGLKDRLRNRHNVSVAETESHDNRQQAVLGVAMVGADKKHVESSLTAIVNFVRETPHAELIDYETELF